MDNEMDNSKDKELLQRLDDALYLRAGELSEQPWLGTRVMAEIEARQRARRWLADNGSLFDTLMANGSPRLAKLAKLGTSTLGSLAVDMTSALKSNRLWSITGAVLLGGLVGWLAGAHLPALGMADWLQLSSLQGYLDGTSLQLPHVAGLSLLTAVLGAGMAAFASQWPHIREYYS